MNEPSASEKTKQMKCGKAEEEKMAGKLENDIGFVDDFFDAEDDEDHENWLENIENEGTFFIKDAKADGKSKDRGNRNDDDLGQAEADESPPPPPSSGKPVQRMALNYHKAGMEGLDKEKINKIIFDVSKGSKFYENEKKKERRVASKIESLKNELATFSADDFKLETRDDPSLKDIPMAVGSSSMLCTSNYNARKYGVRAAMPGFIAKKLCPHLKIIPTHFEKYKNVSSQVRMILAEYDPQFCGMGLDEAYLDITAYVDDQMIIKRNIIYGGSADLEATGGIATVQSACESSGDNSECSNTSSVQVMKLFKECQSNQKPGAAWGHYSGLKRRLIEEIVNEIRMRIFQETKLTASAGIAPNAMLAKVCSDMNKPNGQFYLHPCVENVMEFVKTLPIRKVSGIGRVCEQILNAFGIQCCLDLYEKREILYLLFSRISFEHFLRISLGISETSFDTGAERKSMSTETTFSDTQCPDKLYQICHDLCISLSADLHKEKLAGRNITLKIKLANFEVKTRTKTINNYIHSEEDLFLVAKDILKNQIANAMPNKLSLRLMGLRVADFGHQGNKQNRLDKLFMKMERNYNNCKHDEKTNEQTMNFNQMNQDQHKFKIKHDYMMHNEEICSSQEACDNQISIVKDKVQLTCPICLLKQPDNCDINKHIDVCLSKQKIKEILKQDKTNATTSSECPVAVLTCDAFAANRTNNSKRKSALKIDTRPTKRRTLFNFWNK
eukprot:gene20641-22676_t